MTPKTLPSLALAASIAALSLAGLDLQRSGQDGRPPWPPRPEDMVNLSSESANAPATLLPGQLWSTFFVPPGRTLVVTNATIEGEDMVLGEFLGSQLEFKRRGDDAPAPLSGSGDDPGAPLGWTFRGGSQVALRNDDSAPAPLSYRLVGYLADA